MITDNETYVSREMADILKRLGFDLDVLTAYVKTSKGIDFVHSEAPVNFNATEYKEEIFKLSDPGNIPPFYAFNQFEKGRQHRVLYYTHRLNDVEFISAPSLNVVQRWLREVKGVEVFVEPKRYTDHVEYICYFDSPFKDSLWSTSFFNTYEEALIDGINGALTILQKQQ